MKLLVIALLLVGCGGVQYQTVQLTNRTARAIPELYIYPLGAANHGKSQASLAPNASATLKVPAGHVEVEAISAKVEIDERTRDQPSVTQVLELDRPLHVIFYDLSAKPPGLDDANVIGVAFTLAKSNAPPPNE